MPKVPFSKWHSQYVCFLSIFSINLKPIYSSWQKSFDKCQNSTKRPLTGSLSAVSWLISQPQILAASQLGPPLQLLFPLEVKRAGFFKMASWAELEFCLIWWAELSRAGSKCQNHELSWAELARAKRAKKWAESGSNFHKSIGQASQTLLHFLSIIQSFYIG